MIDPKNVSDREEACLRIFAAALERGEDWWKPEPLRADPRIGDADLTPLLRMMEHYGAITEAQHGMGNKRYFLFRLSPTAQQIVRILDKAKEQANEPGDIVAETQKKMRSHPVVAWFVIGFIGLTLAATLISSLMNIAEKLGWLPKH